MDQPWLVQAGFIRVIGQCPVSRSATGVAHDLKVRGIFPKQYVGSPSLRLNISPRDGSKSDAMHGTSEVPGPRNAPGFSSKADCTVICSTHVGISEIRSSSLICRQVRRTRRRWLKG